MRSCQSDEADGSAEGRGDGREKSRGEQKHVAHACCPHTEVLSIAVAKEQGIQGFHHQQGKYQSHGHEADEHRQAFGAYAREIAHAPEHISLESVLTCPELKQGDDASGDVGDDDTRDEQHDGASEQGIEHGEQCHYSHGAKHSRQDGEHVASEGHSPQRETSSAEHYCQGNAKTCTTVYAKDGGTCQGIAEGSLEQKATCGKSSTAEGGGEHLWHTAMPHDVGPRGVSIYLLAKKYVGHGAQGYVQRPPQDICHYQQDGEGEEKYCLAFNKVLSALIQCIVCAKLLIGVLIILSFPSILSILSTPIIPIIPIPDYIKYSCSAFTPTSG